MNDQAIRDRDSVKNALARDLKHIKVVVKRNGRMLRPIESNIKELDHPGWNVVVK